MVKSSEDSDRPSRGARSGNTARPLEPGAGAAAGGPMLRLGRASTATEVARAAGVSPAAVSRAFQTSGSISVEKRAAVMEAARRLNYRPNQLARSLLTGRSGLVALVMRHLDNFLYPSLVEELAAALGRNGYRVLIFIADTDHDAESIVEELLRHRAEAAIMMSVTLSDHSAEACSAAGVPVLLINNRIDSKHVSSITADNRSAGRTIAAFLAAGEHARYAVISGLPKSSASRDRTEGFRDWLIDEGFGAPRQLGGDYEREKVEQATRALLSDRAAPDAIFCVNDQTALACAGIARKEFGRQLGTDLSIVGFDDVSLASWPIIDLTTFSQPVGETVQRTIGMLQALIETRGESVINVVIPGDLIVRGTARRPQTGLVKIADQLVWRPGRRRRR